MSYDELSARIEGSPIPMLATSSTSIATITRTADYLSTSSTWSKTVNTTNQFSNSATASRTSTSTAIDETTDGTSSSLDVSTYTTAQTECHCNNNQSCNTTSSTCAANSSCDLDTQKCSEGCLPGWQGDRCDQSTGISSTSRPSNGGSSLLLPRDIAILVLTLLFVTSLAINIFVLVRKVRSKRITSGPTNSYDVARYRPDEDGQVNLTQDGSLYISIDYQPSDIMSGLPVETHEFVEPEAVTYNESRSRLSKGEDLGTEMEVGQDEPTDVRPNSLRSVEHGAWPMRNISDVTESGEYSMIQSGIHGPKHFVKDDQLNQQSVQSTQRQEVPLRPPRRSKKAKQTGEEASGGKACAGESSVAYRRDSADCISGRRFSETSGVTMKRRSGVYTAPEDGLAYSDSDFADTSGEEDEADEKYQSALKEAGVIIKDEANANIDDSDPYEKEDFMDTLYRQRALKQTAELETSEGTVQLYEDDSDLYENDDDIEAYRERARAREAMRTQEESTGQPDDEYKDDSDPYENDEDIEAYRERAHAREAMRTREESTGQPDEEYKDDSDPYENDEDIEAYRERARAREAMRRREESTGHQDEEYKDDSDPYENDEDIEAYRERARAREAMRTREESTGQPDEEYKDDSDPYENDEDIEAYRERARAREAMRRREESTGHQDEEYKDDSDPYENDEDIEAYRERARAREAMRTREESTGHQDEEYKDDSDPYENDEDIEAYRERARAREAMRTREESTGQKDEEYEDDSDPYEDYADMVQINTQKQKEHRKGETETKSNELSRKYEGDDSGPNENYEDMDEMYTQRAQKRMNEKIGEAEFEPEITDTSQAYEDEHDIYENEDFMDKLEKERIHQNSTKSTEREDKNDNSNQEDEDDLYENDDFMEHMARRRKERKLDKKHSTAYDIHTANKFDGYSKVIRRHSEGANPAPVPSGMSLYGTSERLNTICDEEGDQIHTRGAGVAQGQVEMEEGEEERVQHADIQDGLSTAYHYDPGAEGNVGSERDSQNKHLNFGEDLSSHPAFNDEQHHQLLDNDEANANMERMRDGIHNQGYDFNDEQNERGIEVGSPETKWAGFNEGPKRPRDLPVIPIHGESIKETGPNSIQLKTKTKNHASDSYDISSTRDTDGLGFDEVNRSLNSYQLESESPFEENARLNDHKDQENNWSPSQKVHNGETWSNSRNIENAWPQGQTSDTENGWPQSPTSEGENTWQQSAIGGTEKAWPQSPTSDTESQSPTGNVGFEQDFIKDTLSRTSKDTRSRQTQFRWSVSETEEEGQGSGTDLDRWARALDTHTRSESTVEFASDNEEFDA